MKHSLRLRLTVIFCVILAAGMLASWLISITFFENYYIDRKMYDLIEIYNQVTTSFRTDGMISYNRNEELSSKCETMSVSLIVIDYSMNVRFISGYNQSENSLEERIRDIIFKNEENTGKILSQTDEYTIQITGDGDAGIEYLEMYGDLSNGNVFVMRTTLETIKEVVSATKKFYAYVVWAVLFLTIIVTVIITVNITKPILNLVHISERMSNLEFDVKYVSDSEDELSTLGNSMNKLSQKLETTISELKTANHELQKDIEKKNEIDEMRKEFISNVSHELKTPIALIQGYAEGLKEGINDDPESQQFYCDVIIDEAAKMNKMVQKLITLNQIESGYNKIDMERFDIVAVVDEILNSTSILLKEKNARVYFDNSKSIFVWSDEFQIQEIITNYLSNAINHLDYDKIIRINIEKNEKNVKISVFNSGEHIPEEDLEKIWIKFYKVDKARTREYGGSGIGLSIVKAIADSLGMKVGVSNVPGGVEFYIEMECEV